MIIVIDGYNVLKQAISQGRLSEHQRAQFINELSHYAKKRSHKIILVFDGGPYEWTFKEHEKGIYIVYSGAQQTADEYIKKYLKDNKSLDLLLISSDNEICKVASRLDIEAVDSSDFYYIVKNALKDFEKTEGISQKKAIKTAKETNEELDLLMQESSKVVQFKSQDFLQTSEDKKSSKRRFSKKDRKRLNKIKKL